MLVIGLKVGEAIIIQTPQGPVEVKFTSIGKLSGEARLGITCDRNIPVMRGEIAQSVIYPPPASSGESHEPA